MKKPAFPENEAARLDALTSYRVLDTAAEPAFDDLTALAAAIVGVPVALVSLIDGSRQWFKSHHGLEETQTARENAFCAHAILTTGPFVVPDAHVDERFADNPLVTHAPSVRFYAGIPLVDAQGFALGTLCTLDSRPRTITPTQLDLLGKLARQVLAQLELRRARDAALESATAKSEFLATLGNEIRTPLNGLLGMTKTLLETSLDTGQREAVQVVQSCGDRMLSVLDKVVGRPRPVAIESRAASGGPAAAPQASGTAGLKVLVAEDNAANRLVVVRYLERLKCQICAVENGRLAVEQWRTGDFDLVLMDCQMPEMDGLAATRAIREMTPDRCAPIIALTASSLPSDREACARAGMTDFLSKPLSFADLKSALARALEPQALSST